MLSAEDIAAVKVAIDLCNGPRLKKELLRIDVLDDDYRIVHELKKKWDENMETKSSALLKNLGLGSSLQEKVNGFVILIGMRMLNWAKYHQCVIGLSYDLAIVFLKSSHFTSRGIIDNKKAAEELMNCKELSVKQRYKLACQYCFVDHISGLFKQMPVEELEEDFPVQYLGDIKLQQLINLWTYIMILKEDQLAELYEHVFILSLETGNKVVVEYCLERTDVIKKDITLIDAAVQIVTKRENIENYYIRRENSITNPENLIYLKIREVFGIEPRVHIDYFIDTLCFLLGKMTVTQQIEFLSIDIKNDVSEHSSKSMVAKVLCYFLHWPYQDNFMRTVNLMWEYLPESNFVKLLEEICKKIECKRGDFYYGEGITYNYRKMLTKFWSKSPQRCKRYVFSHKESRYDGNDDHITLERNKLRGNQRFWGILLLLQDFTNEDRKNIELILENATDEEKRDLILSNDGKSMCIELMSEEKWRRLDLFTSSCLSSQEQRNEFKRELSVSRKAKKMCLELVSKQKWDVAETFLRWSSLSKEEINLLKKEIFYSDDCKSKLRSSILKCKNMEDANKYCEWFSSSEDECRKFKWDFAKTCFGCDTSSVLAFMGKLDLADELSHWCLSSEEIIEYKWNVAYRHRSLEYIKAIITYPESVDSRQSIEDLELVSFVINTTDKFTGGMWEQIETFLTWCLASNEKIKEFKNTILYTENGSTILRSFILDENWNEAESFFSWLGLSSNEIRNLKKETMTSSMMSDVRSALPINDFCLSGRWEKMKLRIRWCLASKEAVLGFQESFNGTYATEIQNLEDDVYQVIKSKMFDKFYSFIEELLRDLPNES